jgi:hypothetical protein
MTWSPELWREATVFNGQFALFAWVGAPVDLAAIVAAFGFAYVLGKSHPGFRLAVVAAILFVAALAAWFAVVAPANAVLATWQHGPVPSDFESVRRRWECGHMIVATLKAMGFLALAIAALASATPRSDAVA